MSYIKTACRIHIVTMYTWKAANLKVGSAPSADFHPLYLPKSIEPSIPAKISEPKSGVCSFIRVQYDNQCVAAPELFAWQGTIIWVVTVDRNCNRFWKKEHPLQSVSHVDSTTAR